MIFLFIVIHKLYVGTDITFFYRLSQNSWIHISDKFSEKQSAYASLLLNTAGKPRISQGQNCFAYKVINLITIDRFFVMKYKYHTACPRSSEPFYLVTNYIIPMGHYFLDSHCTCLVRK